MADVLTTSSRSFYERTKAKLAVSLLLGASSLMLLGFCSYSGGLAAENNTALKAIPSSVHDDAIKTGYMQLSGGFGFAAFCYILAFILLVAAAFYVSPIFCGSQNEKKIIRSPQEIDSGYAPYSENTKGAV